MFILALAWLYQSLNDGTLEWQVRSFVENYWILDKYYKNTAFMINKQVQNIKVFIFEPKFIIFLDIGNGVYVFTRFRWR